MVLAKDYFDGLAESAKKFVLDKTSRGIRKCPVTGRFCDEDECTWFIETKCAIVLIADHLSK